MSIPLWVSESAQSFWQLVGHEEPFPRSLRQPIADALSLAVVLMPALGIARIESWLRSCGIVCTIDVGDRALRASLVARRGHGFLFVDADDGENEGRFSVAHELAHFLRHYLQLRQRVCAQVGPAALQVLDGERAPTPAERVHALLGGVPIGYYVHLMDRSPDRMTASDAIDAAEREADRLAYEILAPAARVLAQLPERPADLRRQVAEHLLAESYLLPAVQAADYAALLVIDPAPTDSLMRRLGFAR